MLVSSAQQSRQDGNIPIAAVRHWTSSVAVSYGNRTINAEEENMQGKNVRVRSSEGGEFDCYRVTPRGGAKVPAIVLASAVHGVNEDLREIADEFASHGYIAAAADPFWRSIPGPLARHDDGTKH